MQTIPLEGNSIMLSYTNGKVQRESAMALHYDALYLQNILRKILA